MKKNFIIILGIIFCGTFLYSIPEFIAIEFEDNIKKADELLKKVDSSIQDSNDMNNDINKEDNQKEVSADWKEEIADQFSQDVSLIKQIIVGGERDSEELDDFMKLFKTQRDWFDKTITETKYFFDPKYNAVMQKKITLQKVVKAQERADEILKELVDVQEVGQSYYKRLRLVILYDINSKIQKAIELGIANEFDTGITENKIKDVVQKIVKDFKDKRLQEIDIEKKVKIDIDSIEHGLSSIKHELEKQKLETGLAERKLFDTNKAYEELELLLEKTIKNMEKLKKEEVDRARWKVEEKYKPILEGKNKKNLELQLKLKKLKKTVEDLKMELSDTN